MAAAGLTLVVQTRAFDRIHYALMLAVSNAAIGGPTTLFFGIEGVEALRAEGLAGLTTAAGETGEAFTGRLQAAGAATPDDLFEALVELEAGLFACDTGLVVAGLKPGDIRSDLGVQVTGLTDILARAEGGRIVYV